MSGRRLVDTNIIVRYLTQDHARHAAVAGKLFAACDRGELTLVVLPSVLAECVFVFESHYKHARGDIARTLAALVASPGIEIDTLSIHLDALERYAQTNLHFIDCTIAATANARGLPVVTFDAGLAKLQGIDVNVEP